MNQQPDFTVRDPLKDFALQVSRKDCLKGFHGHWKTEKDNDLFLGQVCIVCGKKAMYQRHSVGMSRKLDELTFRDNHKLDMLQPYNPDGSVNKDFATYYGDPLTYRSAHEKREEAKLKDHAKLLEDAALDAADAQKPNIFFAGD